MYLPGMDRYYTVADPADFADWGGDDSGLTGAVWEEFVDSVEVRRCECWAGRWLFTRDVSRWPVWGGVSRLTREDLESLVDRGYLREVGSEEFEAAWATAEAAGVELVDGHEDKAALVQPPDGE